MDLDEIKDLMAAFAASDLAEMHLTRGEWTLHLVRSADGSVAAAPAPAATGAPAARRRAPPRPGRRRRASAPRSRGSST